ncbi:MAG: hypothetical protein LBJ62_04875 [Bifidobacteriaceae bacterium]|jgi:hypothetical protein|nr:hypothetical protein [Bifidobacteriaceae bacterium]
MPRDITIITPTPVTIGDWAAVADAASQVNQPDQVAWVNQLDQVPWVDQLDQTSSLDQLDQTASLDQASAGAEPAPPTYFFQATPEADLVTISAPRFGVVLTAAASRRAAVMDQLIRLVPEAGALRNGPAWWTEAWAPWGAGGSAGLAIAQLLAASLGGLIQASEGI